jgi:hypothetical protein
MADYGLSDKQLLEMPIKRFWLLDKNVVRIRAERDFRSLAISCAPHAKDITELHAKLTEELQAPVELNMERDPDATSKLKNLLSK